MDFKIREYNYNDRIGNLKSEAKGKVKSEKHFPIFMEDQEMIFKPLSKTKPLCTPLFAYSEVFWSNIINNYFDEKTPIYRLAICHGYSEQVPKYYDKGTVVPRIEKKDEKLVNLLELFRMYPDEKVDIDNYENYCGVFYDYTNILKSDFFKNNVKLAKQLSFQILISILKGDINYHYENVSIIFKDGKPISVAPMIDHEFSYFFNCLDYVSRNIEFQYQILNAINGEGSLNEQMQSINIKKNLDYIIETYPDVAIQFLDSLEKLKHDLKYNIIRIPDGNYIDPFSSDDYLIGIARYKENDERKATFLENLIEKNEININNFSKSLNMKILLSIDALENKIRKKLKTQGKTYTKRR